MARTDEAEIQRLMAIYASAIDEKDYDGIAACFSPDATAIYSHSNVLTGREAVVGHMKRALDSLESTQHFFANFLIDVDGDNGRLKCDVLGQHVRDGESLLAGGKYNVELGRIGGNWKFTRIQARNVWSDGNKDMIPRTK